MNDNKLTIPFGASNPASATLDCTNHWPGTDTKVNAGMSAWYDVDYLHLTFTTSDAPIICSAFGDQKPVSCDSCVEAFIEPVEGGEYFNFEVNINGSLYVSRRYGRPNPTRLTLDECKSVLRKANPQITEPTSRYGNDNKWTLSLDIPWKLLGVQPRAGLRMRGNFYACSSNAVPPYYLTWAPIHTPAPDFHRPEYFGELILG